MCYTTDFQDRQHCSVFARNGDCVCVYGQRISNGQVEAENSIKFRFSNEWKHLNWKRWWGQKLIWLSPTLFDQRCFRILQLHFISFLSSNLSLCLAIMHFLDLLFGLSVGVADVAVELDCFHWIYASSILTTFSKYNQFPYIHKIVSWFFGLNEFKMPFTKWKRPILVQQPENHEYENANWKWNEMCPFYI